MSWDINHIIDNKCIEVFAFVIYSPYTNKTTGIEGVCKGIDSTGNYISYIDLFNEACKENRRKDLERICLEKTFSRFGEIDKQYENLMLFVNVGEETFDLLIEDKEYLNSLLEKSNLNQNKIVLELPDFKYENLDKAIEIAKTYKEKGFYIALDNIGENYFTLDKIVLINPDMVKLHIKAFDKIDNLVYRKYIEKNIMDFCEGLNIVVVVIGVENIEEFYSTLDEGARFVEGFYINKPMVFDYDNIVNILENINHDEKIQQYMQSLEKDPTKRSTANYAINMFNNLKEEIDNTLEAERENLIDSILIEKPFVNSIYFLDKVGVQSSNIYVKDSFNKQKMELFKEYAKGADHSNSNEYINLVQFSLGIWVTRPFIYPFSNEYCFTVSAFLKDKEEIACIVFNERLLMEHIVMSKENR